MSKLILKLKRKLVFDDIERLERTIKQELDEYGFAIVEEDMFDIYELDDGTKTKTGADQ